MKSWLPMMASIVLSLVFVFSPPVVWPALAQEAPGEESPEKQEPAPESKSDEQAQPPATDQQEAASPPAATEEAGNDGSGDAEPDSAARRRRRMDSTRSSEGFTRQFDAIVSETRKATVEVQSAGRTVSIGLIVDPVGFVVTKQSELKSPLTCVTHDGTALPVNAIYGVHPETDLALLKVEIPEGKTLPQPKWSSPRTLDIGEWLISIRRNEDAVAVGVVGVRERRIRPKSGFMGVTLGLADNRVSVTGVEDKTPASEAGLRAKDAILAVDGTAVATVPELQTLVRSHPPGDEITLRVLRGDREFDLKLVLGDAEALNPMFERSNQQNTMGGHELSQRRQDFPLAVQHDGLIKPRDCGGPVVDIDGQVVGINIARQGRVASLMLPASIVLPVIEELKSGKRTPALVNEKRIDEINSLLEQLRTRIAMSPASEGDSAKKLEQLKAEEEKARSVLDKAMKDLTAAQEARLRAEIELQGESSEVETAKKKIEQLEKERNELVGGTR